MERKGPVPLVLPHVWHLIETDSLSFTRIYILVILPDSHIRTRSDPFKLTQIYSDAPSPTQISSVSLRSTDSDSNEGLTQSTQCHPDSCALVQICSHASSLDRARQISLSPTQIHSVSYIKTRGTKKIRKRRKW